MTIKLPTSFQTLVKLVEAKLPEYPGLPRIFADTLANTYATTLRHHVDGSVFVITGDIPAMWLRDSAAQIKPYLRLAKTDASIANLIAGVVKKQIQCVLLDPYANAFNESANGHCHNQDKTDMSPWIWERKYELDSLCAPLILAHDLWQTTGERKHLDAEFERAAQLILSTIKQEQNHSSSAYSFERLEGPKSDTLANNGRGNPVAYTGMSWSGFRPSDDACEFNYLVPSNMLAVVALEKLAVLPLEDAQLKTSAKILAATLRKGIEFHGVVNHPKHGLIYAYEVDGLGGVNLMDDANVPSLLAIPFMGFCSASDPIYSATRRFVLSSDNPFFYAGTAARGIGSPHTPVDHIWPIALCIQSLTATDGREKRDMLHMLLNTDAGTGLMHESFHKNDPMQFTRPWFAWANSLFAETVLDIVETAT